jgi:hypothetical protein
MFVKRIESLKEGLKELPNAPQNFVERFHYIWNSSINSNFTVSEITKIFNGVFGINIHVNTLRPYIKEVTVLKTYGSEVPINQKKNRYRYYLTKPVTIHTLEHIQKQRSVKANGYKRKGKKTTPVIPSPVTITLKKTRKKLSPSQRVQKISKALSSNVSDLYNYLVSNRLVMPMGRQEDEIGERIADALLFKIPHGGGGVLVGTPTPLAASGDDKYPYFIMSNLLVAWALQKTTIETPTMFIGNGVDPGKSNLKIEHWKKIGLTKDYIIKTRVIDEITFPMSVAEVASRYDLCKAILMTSGHWEGTTSKKSCGLSCCFRDSSIALVQTYPNLHLLVMTYNVRETGYHFGLKYLHGDTIEEL